MTPRRGLALLLAVLAVALGLVWIESSESGPGPAASRSDADRPLATSTVESLRRDPASPAAREGQAPQTAPKTPEPGGRAWLRDPSDIPILGRTVFDVMRNWHGADWPLVEGVIMKSASDDTGNERGLELDTLGDLDGCLEQAAELLLRWYDPGPGPIIIKRFPGTLEGAAAPGAFILDRMLWHPVTNPTRLAYDRDSTEWSETVQWMDSQRDLLLQTAESLIAAQRQCIRSSLENITRFTPPAIGTLYLAPFYMPHEPGVDPHAPEFTPPRGTVLLMSDAKTDCGMFGGAYYIDFREDPTVAAELASWRSLHDAVEAQFLERLANIPLE